MNIIQEKSWTDGQYSLDLFEQKQLKKKKKEREIIKKINTYYMKEILCVRKKREEGRKEGREGKRVAFIFLACHLV